MQYLHVKDIETYHPGYKDRTLTWGKIYFRLVTNPKYKVIPEVDRWRYVAFILLELHHQEPVALDPDYLKGIGFDLRKRPISLTLQMLQKYIEVCNGDLEKPVTQSRVEKSRGEERERGENIPPTLEEVKKYCASKGYHINTERFVKFYGSKGWMVGKNKMKNWHSAVGGWAADENPPQRTKPVVKCGHCKKDIPAEMPIIQVGNKCYCSSSCKKAAEGW